MCNVQDLVSRMSYGEKTTKKLTDNRKLVVSFDYDRDSECPLEWHNPQMKGFCEVLTTRTIAIQGTTEVQDEENFYRELFDTVGKFQPQKSPTLENLDTEESFQEYDGTWFTDDGDFLANLVAEDYENLLDDLEEFLAENGKVELLPTITNEIFGSENLKTFFQNFAENHFYIEESSMSADRSTGWNVWLTLPKNEETLEEYPKPEESLKAILESLSQWVRGEVYIVFGKVLEKCSCCDNWNEIASDCIGGIYGCEDNFVDVLDGYILPELEISEKDFQP